MTFSCEQEQQFKGRAAEALVHTTRTSAILRVGGSKC